MVKSQGSQPMKHSVAQQATDDYMTRDNGESPEDEMNKLWHKMSVFFAAFLVVGSVMACGDTAGASGNEGQGVTATSIKLGVAYVDLAAIHQLLGITYDEGSYPHAYQALVDNINAHGGINGRKIQLVTTAVSPIGTASDATACTQLTEDDKVFAAILYQQLNPLCYIQTHSTVTINGYLSGTAPAGSAPDFTVQPSAASVDPQMIEAFVKAGLFKHKTVGVFGDNADSHEVNSVVLPALQRDHVKVAQTAIDSVPANDLAATNSEQAIVAEKMKSAGVNVLVAVGEGASTWLIAGQANQSSYSPQILATNQEVVTAAATAATSNDPAHLKGLITATTTLPPSVIWKTAPMQQCIKTIERAYPGERISAPPAKVTFNGAYISAFDACQNITLFEAAAKAAGKTLNNATFAKGGESLRNLYVPQAGAVSFGPGQESATVPLYLEHWDSATHQFVQQTTPAGT
jgi:ABC-type branched-subunit amino acid transport system substrate-binding protein